MEYSAILTDSRWAIIKELSKKELSPSEIAKKTHTSVANISQQIRLLEAYGIVKKKRKISDNKSGKPRTTYGIAKDIVETTIISPTQCERKNFDLNFLQKAILNSWAYLKQGNDDFFLRFIVPTDDIINKCLAIGLVKENGESFELLLLTKEEHLKEIRDKYSNQEISNSEGEKKKIRCWTHTTDEIETGLKVNEHHFVELTKDIKPLMDKKEYLRRIDEIKIK